MSDLTKVIAAGVDVASADGEILHEDAVRITPKILAAAFREAASELRSMPRSEPRAAVILLRWADEIEATS
jgi:hypothetical protein